MKNFGDYTYFLYVGSNPRHSFRTYTDPETGSECGYVIGYDKNKQPIYKEWYFDYVGKRQIRVGAKEVDKEGKSAVDFLRKSPEFYRGANGHYVGDTQVLVMFKEINEEADAKIANETRSALIKAQAKAYELKGQELKDIAAVIGVFSDSDAVLVHRVADFAANDAPRFLKLTEDPTLKVRSLVKRAIQADVFRVDGKIIRWGNKTIGADEEDAVSALVKDEVLQKSVKHNLETFGKG